MQGKPPPTAETKSKNRAQLAFEKKKGEDLMRQRAGNERLMFGGSLNTGALPPSVPGDGGAPVGLPQGMLDKGLIDYRGIPTEEEGPAQFGTGTANKYQGQSIARGLGDAAGGVFDFVNTPINAGIRDVNFLMGRKPQDAFQFSSVGEGVRDTAANLTGADIMRDEEVTPGVRLGGMGLELGTSMVADPTNYIPGALFTKAGDVAQATGKAVEAKTPLVAANDALPSPTRSTGFPEAAVDQGIGNRRFESRKLQAKGKTEPEDTYDPYASRTPDRDEAAKIVSGSLNKGGMEPTPAEATATPDPSPAPAPDESGRIPYPQHERSGIFDYSAEYPERDLGIQRFVPRQVPERTTDLLARPDVKDQMAAGIDRGLNFKDWYNTAPIRKFFQDEFGHNQGLELFDRWMDANSATSPRSDVGTNVRNASYWYGQTFREPGQNSFKTIEDLPEKPPNPYGHLAQLLHRGNVAKTLLPGGAGYDFKKNPKPIAYGGALKGDLSKVPVDTHAFRAAPILGQDQRFLSTSFKPEKGALTRNIQDEVERGQMNIEDVPASMWQSVPRPTEYDAFERYWSDLGNDFGLRPGEVQPAGWTGLGEKTGLESDPTKKYMDFTEERILKTARKYNMDPIEVFRLAIRGKMPLLSAGGVAVGAGALDDEER